MVTSQTPTRVAQLIERSRLVFFGLAVRAAVLFIVEVILARGFGPSSYGAITWSLTVINLATLLNGAGLGTACRRFVPIYIVRSQPGAALETVRFSVRVTLALSVGIGLSVVALALWFDDEAGAQISQRARLLLILCAALPFWALQRLFLGVAAGLKRVALKVMIEDYFMPLGLLAVVLSGVLTDSPPSAIASGYVIVYAVASIVAGCGIFRDAALRGKPTAGSSSQFQPREVLSFSWPLIFSELLGKTTGMMEFLVIGVVATTTQVGVFRPASDLSATMVLILMGFSFLYLPMTSEFFGGKRFAEWRLFNTRVARLVMLLSFPVFGVLFFYPHEILGLVYGQEYVASASALRVLAVAYFLNTAVGFTGLNLIAAGYTRAQMAAKLTSVTLLVMLITVLVPSFGTLGAAIATLASLSVSNTISLVVSTRRLRIHPFDRLYVSCILIFLAAAALLKMLVDNVASGLAAPFVFGPAMGALVIVLLRAGVVLDKDDLAALHVLIRGRSSAWKRQ